MISLFLLLFTSFSEGMPNVVLEAAMAGRTIIASDAGGVPELITNGERGLLFPPGDKDAALSCLERILSNPEEGLRMAESARKGLCEEYNPYKAASDTDELFKSIINEKQ